MPKQFPGPWSDLRKANSRMHRITTIQPIISQVFEVDRLAFTQPR